MDPKASKLRQESRTTHELRQEGGTREFATVDEMLRHDAEQVEVPAEIEVRLAESVAREPKASSSWWRRLFS